MFVGICSIYLNADGENGAFVQASGVSPWCITLRSIPGVSRSRHPQVDESPEAIPAGVGRGSAGSGRTQKSLQIRSES